jgi:probable rRNA maturation factor
VGETRRGRGGADAAADGPGSRSAAGGIRVDVSDRQKLLRASARGIERLVRQALAAEGVEEAEIGVVLVDDRRIAALHRRWLGVPGPTDVITFDLSAGPCLPRAALAGDIVVSVETARRVARQVGWTPRQELFYYIVHGLLHLTGYDDHAPADRRAMRARERKVLRACGLPAPPRPRPPGRPATSPRS